MEKKGELTFRYIILLILGLVTLITVIILFRKQIATLISSFADIIGIYSTEAEEVSIGLVE